MSQHVPRRGDIVYIDFDPSAGKEQMKRRPALVLSSGEYNSVVKLSYMAPITSKPKGTPLEVPINGKKITGVALAHQIKAVDYEARQFEFIEKAPAGTTDQCVSLLFQILS